MKKIKKKKKPDDYFWASPSLDVYRIGIVDWLSDEVYTVYRNGVMFNAPTPDKNGSILQAPVMYDNMDDAVKLFESIKSSESKRRKIRRPSKKQEKNK